MRSVTRVAVLDDHPAAIGATLGLTVVAVADRIRAIVARLVPFDLVAGSEAA